MTMSDTVSPTSASETGREDVRAELEETRERLEIAEWALEQISVEAGHIDKSVAEMVTKSVALVQERWDEAREKINALVADAEELRALAERRLEEADTNAKQAVAHETKQLLDDATELQDSARTNADKMVADAEQRRAEIEADIDSKLAEAEAIYKKVENHIANREAILAEVRKKADQIIRNAKVTAETIRDDAVAQAKKSTDIASMEAARLIQSAKDEVRAQMQRVTAQERDAKERLERARAEMANN